MLYLSESNDRPEPVTKENNDLYLRKNIRSETRTEGEAEYSVWVYDEAYMQLDEDATAEEIESEFDLWFEYASEWEAEKPNTIEQLRADVDYLLAITEV